MLPAAHCTFRVFAMHARVCLFAWCARHTDKHTYIVHMHTCMYLPACLQIPRSVQSESISHGAPLAAHVSWTLGAASVLAGPGLCAQSCCRQATEAPNKNWHAFVTTATVSGLWFVRIHSGIQDEVV